MSLKVALVATMAAGALAIAACGGGGSDGDGTGGISSSGTTANSGSSNTSNTPLSPSTTNSTNAPSGSNLCHAQTTVVGGNLFVAEQGPIGVTLLSDGGVGRLPGITLRDGTVRQYEFWVMYDTVFGMPPGTVSNQQDKWTVAQPLPSWTPVGTSTQVDFGPPSPDLAQANPVLVSTYPKDLPLQLWLIYPTGSHTTNDFRYHYSSTASIRKDVPIGSDWYLARVAYGPNNTATVTFFAGTDLAQFSVGLTNVFGTGCPE